MINDVDTIRQTSEEWHEFYGRTFRWMEDNSANAGTSSCRCSYAPGARLFPAHAHENVTETVTVISGEGKLLVGDKIIMIKRGSVIRLPKHIPHSVWNTGKERLELLSVFDAPKNKFDYTFYSDVDFPEFL